MEQVDWCPFWGALTNPRSVSIRAHSRSALAVKQILLGPLAGIVVGWVVARAMDAAQDRDFIAEAAEGVVFLSTAFAAHLFAEIVGGNGFIAAFVAGAVFGNTYRHEIHFIAEFMEGAGQLLTMSAFLVFGALLLPTGLEHISLNAVLVAILFFDSGAHGADLSVAGRSRSELGRKIIPRLVRPEGPRLDPVHPPDDRRLRAAERKRAARLRIDDRAVLGYRTRSVSNTARPHYRAAFTSKLKRVPVQGGVSSIFSDKIDLNFEGGQGQSMRQWRQTATFASMIDHPRRRHLT